MQPILHAFALTAACEKAYDFHIMGVFCFVFADSIIQNTHFCV